MTTPNFADKTVWTGDNLDILRGLNSDCVDLIYLDPPFNSNRNYAAPVGSAAAGAAFKDTWTLSDLDVAWMGLIADEQPAMYQVLQTAGLTHGKGMQSYLCMMAVRLLEMRRVLKDTGSIYLHCDPTASHYLKMLMDSIYGRTGTSWSEIIWKRTSDATSDWQARPQTTWSSSGKRCTFCYYDQIEPERLSIAFGPDYDPDIRSKLGSTTFNPEMADGTIRLDNMLTSRWSSQRQSRTYELNGMSHHRLGWRYSARTDECKSWSYRREG